MRKKKEMTLFILDRLFPSGDYASIEHRHDLQVELKKLSVTQLELLTCKSAGMTHAKTAEQLGKSVRWVTDCINKIKKCMRLV